MTLIPTADICDEHGSTARVCLTQLRGFGGRWHFSGRVATVRCLEDNVLLRAALAEPGQGRVLVVDGQGSLNTALMGEEVARLAAHNGWAGVIVHGAVRDTHRLRDIDLGIRALGANPRRSGKAGAGIVGEPVTFGGATFAPGDVVYVDDDGVVVLPGDHDVQITGR